MKIVLTPNPYRDKQFRTVQQAKKILESCGVETVMCLPFDVDRDYELPKTMDFRDLHREIKNADMLVCFGGDGTILHASKIATAHGLPILGVNIGTMGFIAELEAGELELLRKLPTGDYTLEPRSMIDVTVTGANGQKLLHETALNDAVVTKGAIARVIQIGISCDGVDATAFSGDGVIVCTATGSTAYSLSAGGPVVEPTARNLIVSPICAHSVHANSYVLSPERTVTVQTEKTGYKPIFLSADGGRAFSLRNGDAVEIRRSKYETKLVRLSNKSFCDILQKKMLMGVLGHEE